MVYDEGLWHAFQGCVCMDMSSQNLCQADLYPGHTIAYVLLEQCMPYFQRLVFKQVLIIVAGILLLFGYLMFVICRTMCNQFGGRRATTGLCVQSSRRRFIGYSVRHLLIFAIFCAITTIATIVISSLLLWKNHQLSNEIGTTMETVRISLQNMSYVTSTVAIPALHHFSFLSPSLFSQILGYMDDAISYSSTVLSVLDYIDRVEGIGVGLGRKQGMDILVACMLGITLVGFFAGMCRVVLKGWLHAAAATLLALLGFGLIVVCMLNLILGYTSNDMCRYLRQEEKSIPKSLSEGCGGLAIGGLSQLLDLAQEQYFYNFACPKKIDPLCIDYFDCAKGPSNFCLNETIGNSTRFPPFPDVTMMLMNSKLLVPNKTDPSGPKVPSDFSLFACLMSPGCFGNPDARDAANSTITNIGTIGYLFGKLRNEVLPMVTCSISVPVIHQATRGVCQMSTSTFFLGWCGIAYYCVAHSTIVAFFLGTKRFNQDNSRAVRDRRQWQKENRLGSPVDSSRRLDDSSRRFDDASFSTADYDFCSDDEGEEEVHQRYAARSIQKHTDKLQRQLLSGLNDQHTVPATASGNYGTISGGSRHSLQAQQPRRSSHGSKRRENPFANNSAGNSAISLRATSRTPQEGESREQRSEESPSRDGSQRNLQDPTKSRTPPLHGNPTEEQRGELSMSAPTTSHSKWLAHAADGGSGETHGTEEGTTAVHVGDDSKEEQKSSESIEKDI